MNKEFTLMSYFTQETGVSEESLRAFLSSPANRYMVVKYIMDIYDTSKQTAHAMVMGFHTGKTKSITPLFLGRMIPTIKALQENGVHIGAPTDTDTEVSTRNNSPDSSRQCDSLDCGSL